VNVVPLHPLCWPSKSKETNDAQNWSLFGLYYSLQCIRWLLIDGCVDLLIHCFLDCWFLDLLLLICWFLDFLISWFLDFFIKFSWLNFVVLDLFFLICCSCFVIFDLLIYWFYWPCPVPLFYLFIYFFCFLKLFYRYKELLKKISIGTVIFRDSRPYTAWMNTLPKQACHFTQKKKKKTT